MVPKELLGNEEEGKGLPFLGSQKKGNQQKGTSNLASIAHKANSNPPFRLLWMLYVATAMDPLPSARDGVHGAVSAMGFLPCTYVKKPTTRSTYYALATNPGRQSNSTPHPFGQRMGAICWFPLLGGDGDDTAGGV